MRDDWSPFGSSRFCRPPALTDFNRFHRRRQNLQQLGPANPGGFSPLLDGDGVASEWPERNTLLPRLFQSPSRWGRCCIQRKDLYGPTRFGCFSPLLDGDGVASKFNRPEDKQRLCFSPLLDGDGVASRTTNILTLLRILFQSPSRWGRCCI